MDIGTGQRFGEPKGRGRGVPRDLGVPNREERGSQREVNGRKRNRGDWGPKEMRIRVPKKGDLLVPKGWDAGVQRETIWSPKEKGFGAAKRRGLGCKWKEFGCARLRGGLCLQGQTPPVPVELLAEPLLGTISVAAQTLTRTTSESSACTDG